MGGALEGVRVVEFTQIIAAPFAGMLLSDMGADVIKIEPPEGEPWRLFSQFIPKESKTFISLNRGKRSLPLDLTRPEGQRVAHDLVRTADVALINYRPDVPGRFGLDYETLATLNPRLIYCENTAFGRRGPDSHRLGYDIIIQAMSGLMAAINKTVDGVPQVLALAAADFATGITMAWAVSAALYARERTGRGQKVEAALLSTALALQTSRFTCIDLGRRRVDARLPGIAQRRLRPRRRMGGAGPHPGDAAARPHPWRRFTTAPTRPATATSRGVGCLSDALRRKFLAATGLRDSRFDDPQWRCSDGGDPPGERGAGRPGRGAARLGVERGVAGPAGCGAGVPCGPVRFVEEIRRPAGAGQRHDRRVGPHLGGADGMAGPMVKMSGTPTRAQGASPALGEHTDEILGSLGYDADRSTRCARPA
ncbi:MAG: CoA transferase [Dehalococcoidia bacterium]